MKMKKKKDDDDDDDNKNAEKTTTITQQKTTTKEFEGYSKIWHEAAKSLSTKEMMMTKTNDEKKKTKKKKEEDDEEEENFSKLLLSKELVAKEAIREREKQNEKIKSRKSGDGFQNLVRSTGTASDKIASNTIAVQDDAAANLKQLESLLELCEKARLKGGKRGAAQAIQALEELFKSALLPSDRKLKYFADQNLKDSDKFPHERKRLMYWYVEDYIKRCYHRFVQSLEALSKDPLVILKEKSMKCAFGLLVNKPEAELQLLRLLTNKLGDPQRKMASNASHLLLEVTVKHPMMKSIVAREVEQFMFRRGVSLKAQYYGAVLLNQMPLSHKGEGPKLAKQLVETYFSLFQFLYDKSRYTTENSNNDGDRKEDSNDSPAANGGKKKRFHPKGGRGGGGGRGRGRGRGKKGAATPTTSNSANEQIGSGVDARVVSALLTGINRAFPYVAQSERESMVEKIAPALFTTAHSPNLAASIQALTLIFQLHSSKKSSPITDRYYRALYEVCNHPQVPKAAHAAPFLSLVFKSLKADNNNNNNNNNNNKSGDIKKHKKQQHDDDNDDDDDDDDKKDKTKSNERIARSLAIVKRLLQVAMHAPATFACGSLMATSEFFRIRPAHWKMVEKEEGKIKKSAPNGVSSRGEDSESESEGDNNDDEEGKENMKESKHGGKTSNSSSYDPYKREPLYANAHLTCLWELTALASNVHPSVAAMAKSLLNGDEVSYDGDPLTEMTLMSFLDKWLMKKVGSKIAKKAKSSVFDTSAAIAQSSFVPGTLEFAAMKESEVDPSEIFFHRYYSVKQSEKLVKLKLKEKKDDDDDGSESEEEESDSDEGKKKKSDFGHSESDDDSDSDEENDEDEDSDSESDSKDARKKIMKDFAAEEEDDDDTDEDDIVAKAENKEEKIDTDKFNYDALAAAYGEKPGYLLSKKKRKASRDEYEDFIKEEEEEEEEEESDEDEDELKGMLLDESDDDDEFSGGDDDVFASAEDYEEKIESDFTKNVPVDPEYFSSAEKKQKKRRKSK